MDKSRRTPIRSLSTPSSEKRGGGSLLFYVLPPALIGAVMAFCAFVPNTSKLNELAASRASVARVPAVQASQKAVQQPSPGTEAATGGVKNLKTITTALGTAVVEEEPISSDPNADLVDYTIPDGMCNLLDETAALKASVADPQFPLANAVDGSTDDDACVAVSYPAEGVPASVEWQAAPGTFKNVASVVIFGGGSRSPKGKLCGGFRVEVFTADKQTATKDFCVPGFALEGFEVWRFEQTRKVNRVRIVSLKTNRPIVLRELQLVGPEDSQATPETNQENTTEP